MNNKKAIFYAILAAALYALNAPVSKLLLSEIPSTMMAGRYSGYCSTDLSNDWIDQMQCCKCIFAE